MRHSGAFYRNFLIVKCVSLYTYMSRVYHLFLFISISLTKIYIILFIYFFNMNCSTIILVQMVDIIFIHNQNFLYVLRIESNIEFLRSNRPCHVSFFEILLIISHVFFAHISTAHWIIGTRASDTNIYKRNTFTIPFYTCSGRVFFCESQTWSRRAGFPLICIFSWSNFENPLLFIIHIYKKNINNFFNF